MTAPPASLCIYHITHVNNLPAIVAAGGLISDAEMTKRGGPAANIGMSKIKRRRLSLPVTCHPGDKVGDFVPFYFCPRSVMLHVIHRANHPDLTYRDGQRPIVHLEADLRSVVVWAGQQGQRWAFSLSNAGASYTEFRSDVSDLGEIDWNAVAATDFRSPTVKEAKQSEFLLHNFFPLSLIRRIGAHSPPIATKVRAALAGSTHQPAVTVQPTWYF